MGKATEPSGAFAIDRHGNNFVCVDGMVIGSNMRIQLTLILEAHGNSGKWVGRLAETLRSI